MNIAVIGSGYVGLVSGACFAERSNRIVCVDVDEEKITNLNKGVIPIYEPGLEEIVKKCHKLGTLQFTTDCKMALEKSDIVFIAVGTPMGENGNADLQYVLKVAETIGQLMDHQLIIVDKSTVPVGTAIKVRDTINCELEKRGVEIAFNVVSNPEFLAEGHAIEDFMKPSRVVIGSDNPKVIEVMKELYAPFTRSQERFIEMDILSAEMTKYVANSMLATRISFMNDIAGICEAVGADINKVRKGIGSDSRIGNKFLFAGPGFGGSCFPKDLRALKKTAEDYGCHSPMLEAVIKVNERQKKVLARKVVARYGENLEGKIFAVWGLAFKRDTDDMRESPAIDTVIELTKRGARIVAFDPQAMDEAKKHYLKDVTGVSYADNMYAALEGADALIVITEWHEFEVPDTETMKSKLKQAIIFDGRNLYSPAKMKEIGFEYHCIGVKNS